MVISAVIAVEESGCVPWKGFNKVRDALLRPGSMLHPSPPFVSEKNTFSAMEW